MQHLVKRCNILVFLCLALIGSEVRHSFQRGRTLQQAQWVISWYPCRALEGSHCLYNYGHQWHGWERSSQKQEKETGHIQSDKETEATGSSWRNRGPLVVPVECGERFDQLLPIWLQTLDTNRSPPKYMLPCFLSLQTTHFSMNSKTRRMPYHLSKLVLHGINRFGTKVSSHSRKKKKKPGIFAENIDDPQRFMDDHKMVFCTPLNKFCQITRKSWLWYYYEVPQSRHQTHSLPRKCWLGLGRSNLTFWRSA